jgi:hypothetical protein
MDGHGGNVVGDEDSIILRAPSENSIVIEDS